VRLRILALSGALALLCGCEVVGPDSRPFAEVRYYHYAASGNPEACVQAGCWQLAIFCPDRGAEYMISDIAHRGRYGIEGDRLTLRLGENSETRSRIVYRLSADGETLTEAGSGRVLARDHEHEAEAGAFICG
jgi:hypothetical protein